MSRFRTLALAGLALLLSGCGETPNEPGSVAGDEARAAVTASSSCVLPAAEQVILDRIGSLRGEVDGIASAGSLNGGQEQALLRHLANAERQLLRGETCATRDQLEAFRRQFETFVGEAELSDRDAFEIRLQSRLALGSGDPVGLAAEEYAPGVEGEFRTIPVGGGEIPVEVIDGLAIFTGDIILGFADEVEAAATAGLGPSGRDGPQAVGPCSDSNIFCEEWEDGVIGYDYFRDWGDFSDNQLMIDRIQEAIRHWEANTGLRFERRASGQRIVFRNGSGCSSYIGRNPFAIFDPQYVFLKYDPDGGKDCRNVGTIIHEIGHAVGFWHEQSRNDRGDWVDINYDAIDDGKEGNFFQYLTLGNDLGEYDYGSIMHYPCDAFQNDGATKNSVEPIVDGFGCDDIGQRDALSESNILGAYWLYPPEYTIGGASNGDVSDRFLLFADFETEPLAEEFIHWTVDRHRVATGSTFSTLEAGVGPGEHVIGADIVIDGVTLTFRAVRITIANEPPVVSLGADRTVDMNREISLFAEVADREDGTCPATVCTYTWDPAPDEIDGAVARYRFPTVPTGGTATIRVTVADGSGATDDDEVVLTVVDSPPVPVITSPVAGASFGTGTTTAFAGSATDANDGTGPGPATLACDRLVWSSSDLSDRLTGTPGCGGTIEFGEPGPRTLTLAATDATGNTETASLRLEVDGCVGGCAPSISFVLDTAVDLDGSLFSPPFSGPGYYLGTAIEMTASVADLDGPAPGTVALEWEVQPPCFLVSCDPIAIGSASVIVPNSDVVVWRPSDDVAEWGNCTTVAFPFIIRVRATDLGGASRVFSRTVHLACPLV